MNTYIYIAPIKQESSEALAAEEMTFESMLYVCVAVSIGGVYSSYGQRQGSVNDGASVHGPRP